MPLPPDFRVAIIGGGLAGLGLALALHSRSVPCTVYEAVPAADRVDMGSMQLGPNALNILDQYGIYPHLAEMGNSIESVAVKDDQNETLSLIPMGSRSQWGYAALRIYRRALVKALYTFLEAKGVQIYFGKKFQRIVSDSRGEDVHFQFADGTTAQASLLVAADGVHSRIRQALFPDTSLIYTGQLGVGGSVGLSVLGVNGSDKDHTGLYRGRQGTFILLKQNPEGSDFMAYKQRPEAERSRDEWAAMFNDKNQLHSFLEQGIEDWPEAIQNAIKAVPDESMWMWPIYELPELPTWLSSTSKIVLIGDAAHAMPPASAQGGNMAFEDGHALALLLTNVPGNVTIEETLHFWQDMRKERVRSIVDFTLKMMKARLPTAEREKLSSGEAFDFEKLDPTVTSNWDWLWNGVSRQEEKIRNWLAAQNHTEEIS